MTRPHWKTIVVVDDDADVRLALRKRFREAGWDVLPASNGTEALNLAHDTTVDAITLDVAMPGDVDGLEVASALSRDPQTAQIPVIFVTGIADAHFKEKCEAVGGKYFVSKPYDADSLVCLLESIFGKDELAEIKKLSEAKRRQPVE